MNPTFTDINKAEQILMVPMIVIPILSTSDIPHPPGATIQSLTLSDATQGFGTHFWDVPPQNVTLLRKVWFKEDLFLTHAYWK